MTCGCGRRIPAKVKYAGRRVRCPDCSELVAIPTLDEFLASTAAGQPPAGQTADRGTATAGRVARGRWTNSRPEPGTGVFHQLAYVRQEEVPDPPRWVFLSHVFEFPWRTRPALVHWIWLSTGLAVTGSITVLNHWLMTELGLGGVFAAMCFLLAQIAVTAWSVGFLVTCSFSIIQDTAAGNDRVEAWPDSDFRDWMIDTCVALYLFAVTGVIAWAVARLLSLAVGVLRPQLFVLHGLLFPAALVSSLDADSVWFPYSRTVVRSLVRIPVYWLACYGLLAVVWLITVAGLLAVLMVTPWLLGLIGGPLVASSVFLSARLLGRLAWKIGEDAALEAAPPDEFDVD